MRSLALVRHAKSAYPAGVPDHDRPLAARGRRDAPQVGAAIHDVFGTPDLVLVSTAVRAQQTWDLARELWPTDLSVRVEPRVYEATSEGLLELIREVSPAISTLVVVGHVPGVSDLAVELGSGTTSAAFDRMTTKYPTCGVALLDITGDWMDCSKQTSELRDFVVARGEIEN